MNKKTELEYAICSLFSYGKAKRPETQELMKNLDYEALLQALKYNAETVYEYTAEGGIRSACNYCGPEVFHRPASLLCSVPVSEAEDVVHLSRSLELWLLEDFTFGLVSCTEIECAGGSFSSAYRVLRSDDLDDICSELTPDVDALALDLVKLTGDYYGPGQVLFEL